MKSILTLIAAAIILAGAYAITFGVPTQIATLIGQQEATTQSSQAASPGAGSGPRAGGGRPSGRGGGRSEATVVVMNPLEERPYTIILRTIGSAKSVDSVDVISQQSGIVTEANLPSNGSVELGDVLVQLESRNQQLSLEIARAELDQAQATVDRYRSITGTITAVTLAEAELDLELKRVNVDIAQLALEERAIRSPLAGRLGLSEISVGDVVSSGNPIVTVSNSSFLIAEFEVPERSIALLEVGRTVLIGTPTYAGRVFEGKISGFDSQLDSVTRSATVQAKIDNSEGLLLSGMTFAVRLIEETDPLPVVPSTAITWDRNGSGVWTVNEGTATRLPVTIRYRQGDNVWLDTDIPLGTQIVEEGAAKLRTGSVVTNAGDDA